tara:strand:- start:9908 stop:11299 length:1392 start_codon:yes stop_codon:yes gene_type:complete
MFKNIPLNITGPSYQSRSRPLASQVTRNFFQQVNETGKSQYSLMPFPGLVIQDRAYGKDRGMYKRKDTTYRVSGNKLYRITNGVHEGLALMPGTGRCIFADDGLNLFINTDYQVYWWDGVSLQQVTDPDIKDVLSIDILNNQFIFTDKKFTTISEVGDGTSANGLDKIGAESNPDELVRDYVFQQVIYRFGSQTCEPWYNTGTGRPPIARLEGQIIEVGLGAKFSIDHNKDFMYFLGHDRRVYRANSSGAQAISSKGIITAIEKVGDISEAIGYCLTFQDQDFYLLTVGTNTFVNNQELGKDGWFELGDTSSPFPCTSLVYDSGKNYLADSSNGNLYTLDINTFTYGDKPIMRERVTDTISAKALGADGKRLQMSRMLFDIEQGTGLIEGNEDPRMRIETSQDGGKSWTHETWLPLGRQGQGRHLVEWHSTKTFYGMVVRVTFNEPCPIFLYGASIDVRVAGR